MTVTVLFFARARDLAGVDRIELELPEGSTVAALREALAAQHPTLVPILPQLFIAVNENYAVDSVPIPAGAKVACFPPVSGG